jgi:two-component system, chemotaxis family, CheB/CheR fusion protein
LIKDSRDVGRQLADLTRRFDDADLLSDAQAVLSSRAPLRREVKAHDGAWFIRGTLPYQSDDSGIEGVVITFAGISEMKAAEREIEAARAYLDSIIATIRQPLVVLGEQLRVISASSSFHRTFSVKPEELVGRHLWLQPIILTSLRSMNSWTRSRPAAAPPMIMRSTSNCRAWDVARS